MAKRWPRALGAIMSKGDRRIEHQRRRAKLKRQPLGEETKTERVHERWDKWSWD